MLKNLILAVVLLLQIGLSFAQNTGKIPPSPFLMGGASPPTSSSGPLSGLPRATGNLQSGINIVNPPVPAQIEEKEPIDSIMLNADDPFCKAYPDYIGCKQEPINLDNIADNIFTDFKNGFINTANLLKPYVYYLFYGLCTFSILVMYFFNAITGAGFKEFTVNFIIALFNMVVWGGIIMHFPNIAKYIPEWFNNAGMAVSDVPISKSDILDYAVKYADNIWNKVSIFRLGDALMYIFFFFPTFYMLCLIVKNYMGVMLEAVVIGPMNIIYIAAAGHSKLEHYAKRPFLYLVNIGLKLMFLQVFFGVISTMLAKYSAMPLSKSVVIIMFIVTFICYWLTNDLMRLIDNFIMGSGQSSLTSKGLASAIKDTLLDTYNTINAANMAKDLMTKGIEAQMQSQMERMSHPDYAQQFAPKHASTGEQKQPNKFGHDNGTSDSVRAEQDMQSKNAYAEAMGLNPPSFNHATFNDENSFSNKPMDIDTSNAINSYDKKETPTAKDTTTQPLEAVAEKPSPSNNLNSSSFNAGNSIDTPQMPETQKHAISSPNNKKIGYDFDGNIKTQSTANKTLDRAKGIGVAANQLAKAGFDLKKANHMIDHKLQQGENKVNKKLMSATQEAQERLWNNIYLGKAPSHSSEAAAYIKHGEALKSIGSEYRKQYSDYVTTRSVAFQAAEMRKTQESMKQDGEQKNMIMPATNDNSEAKTHIKPENTNSQNKSDKPDNQE
jgi:TrbL/VirB6 plasmid conjugal transfer protein